MGYAHLGQPGPTEVTDHDQDLGIEATQAIQFFRSTYLLCSGPGGSQVACDDNSVPLVAERPTGSASSLVAQRRAPTSAGWPRRSRSAAGSARASPLRASAGWSRVRCPRHVPIPRRRCRSSFVLTRLAPTDSMLSCWNMRRTGGASSRVPPLRSSSSSLSDGESASGSCGSTTRDGEWTSLLRRKGLLGRHGLRPAGAAGPPLRVRYLRDSVELYDGDFTRIDPSAHDPAWAGRVGNNGTTATSSTSLTGSLRQSRFRAM